MIKLLAVRENNKNKSKNRTKEQFQGKNSKNKSKSQTNEQFDFEGGNEEDLINTDPEDKQKAENEKIIADNTKLRTYLKEMRKRRGREEEEKRKKLRDLERKEKLNVKLKRDFVERERDFCREIDALQKCIHLEKEKYFKVEKMNSILEMELARLRG